jgi:FkbM family methyltransferase
MTRCSRLCWPICPMANQGVAFNAVRCLVRAIPNKLRGKTRVARAALLTFRGKRPVRLPDRFGNRLWCPSLEEPIAAAIFATGVYEADTLTAILAQLNPNGVYVDVGANVGALALPVAALRKDVRIVCVEGDPDIASILRRNVMENGRSNITMVECLAGPAAHVAVPFYRAPAHKFGMGSVGPQFGGPPIVLKQRALDDVLDELGIAHVDVMKLDIEGAEFGALRGLMRRLTNARPPAIVFEFVDWAEARIPGQSPGEAQAFLISLGYRLFRLARGGAPGVALGRPLTAGSAMILALPPVSLGEGATPKACVKGNLNKWGSRMVASLNKAVGLLPRPSTARRRRRSWI